MALDRAGKAKFINDLLDSVKATLLARIDAMPEDWDGIELRWYSADAFAEQVMTPSTQAWRHREYKNTVAGTMGL